MTLGKLEIQEGVDSAIQTLFVDVILPVPLPRLYTYRVPLEMNNDVAVGSRIIVQFGQKKIVTAIIFSIHETPPSHYEAKYILEVLDETPLINSIQFRLFQWMAAYYACTLGEIINAAIPSGLKLSSSSRIQLNPGYIQDGNEADHFSEKEIQIIAHLRGKESFTYEEASRLLNIKNINPVIKSLLRKGRILLFEEVREKYNPKTLQKVRLTKLYLTEPAIKDLFDRLDKKPKQLDILLKYLQQIPLNHLQKENETGLDKKLLLALSGSPSPLNTLLKNKVFEEFTTLVPRFESAPEATQNINLTPSQKEAKDKISALFRDKETVLLHGITGSGKTEVYIELIKNALDGGSQVLYLLPEIALTTQIVSRLSKIFGSRMGIYHSRFSDHERVGIWKGISSGEISFIVGVRSSVFLPFDNLGLIIVDEEHEPSYKQYDPAPRYHARDTAIMLAKFHSAKTLLGSATPSIESYYQATQGRWGLATMLQRYGEAQLPLIEIADMKKERRDKTLRNDFSSLLIDGLKLAKQNKEQVILFQNRRGYAPMLACMDCAYIPKCNNCSVSLTYHLYKNELNCHYCGYKEAIPKECPACGSPRMKAQGYGTEKIEEDLKLFFPESNVSRMDLDTTRTKNSYQDLIKNFETGKTDILVGTQMISKGFDFGNVALVGIFDADRMIHFPDFRSYERAFQMITQVSGRAGRRDKQGKVIIQSANPTQPLLLKVLENDYQGLFDHEIAERKKFNYPPFSRIIKITCKDVVETKAATLAEQLSEKLLIRLGSERVLGPEASLIFKIRNYFLYEIYLKLEKDKLDIAKVKLLVLKEVNELLSIKEYTNSRIAVDVDPV